MEIIQSVKPNGHFNRVNDVVNHHCKIQIATYEKTGFNFG